MAFKNPYPVVVVLLPVDDGILLIRRGEGPQEGHWAFPGGYLEMEEWREGAARELLEETNIRIPPSDLEVFEVASTPDSTKVIIFALHTRTMTASELPEFIPNKEVIGRMIATKPEALAFGTHTDVLAKWFEIKNWEDELEREQNAIEQRMNDALEEDRRARALVRDDI